MKRDFLKDLGLEKEAIDVIMDENGKDIEEAKGDIKEVKKKLEQAEEQVAERDKQLEELKGADGDNAKLKEQIETLQAENARVQAEKDAEIEEMKRSAAIGKALGDTVHDAGMVIEKLDMGKLIVGDDGKVTGLDEQVKSLKESKPFLFKAEKPEANRTGFRAVGAAGGFVAGAGAKGEVGKVDMKAAIEARINSQKAE